MDSEISPGIFPILRALFPRRFLLVCHENCQDGLLRVHTVFGLIEQDRMRAVRDFIWKYQPEYFFCGHIHEAEGVAIDLGKTRARNVGKAGYLLELD